MACINPDGTLTDIARSVLEQLRIPRTAEQAAAAVGLPLYRVRATFRETGRAGLIRPSEPESAAHLLTELGEEALALDAD